MPTSQNQSIRSIISKTPVLHSQFKEAIGELNKLFNAKVEDDYVDGLCITGETGVGKTYIKDQFLKQHMRYNTEDRTIIPVLSFDMPTGGQVKGFSQAGLAAMDSRYLVGTETALSQRFAGLLKACGTQMVIVDEAQHFVQRNGRKSQERAADTLKTLMNEAKVCVVLIGTDPLRDLMSVNEQLRRRFSTKIKLREWSPYDEADLGEVARIFKTFMQDSRIDLNYQDLMNAAFVKRLVYGCGGRICFIAKLLIEACTLAKAKGQKELRSISNKFFARRFGTKQCQRQTRSTKNSKPKN